MSDPLDIATVDHAPGKLWRTVALGSGMTALLVWFLMSNPHGGGRRYAWLVSLLGPNGLWWLIAVAALACAVLAIAALRLLVLGDKSAATASKNGVVVRTMFGTQRYDWSEVAGLSLQVVTAAGRDHQTLKVEGKERRNASLSAATVEGGADALERWIERATAMMRSQ